METSPNNGAVEREVRCRCGKDKIILPPGVSSLLIKCLKCGMEVKVYREIKSGKFKIA